MSVQAATDSFTKDNVKGKFLGSFKPSPEKAAKDGALEVCKRQGGEDCQILIVYKNECVALAATELPYKPAVAALGKPAKKPEQRHGCLSRIT